MSEREAAQAAQYIHSRQRMSRSDGAKPKASSLVQAIARKRATSQAATKKPPEGGFFDAADAAA